MKPIAIILFLSILICGLAACAPQDSGKPGKSGSAAVVKTPVAKDSIKLDLAAQLAADKVVLRNAPSTRGDKLALLDRGTILHVVGRNMKAEKIGALGPHYWYRVYRTSGLTRNAILNKFEKPAEFHSGEAGWVYGSFLHKVKLPVPDKGAAYVAARRVVFRAGPTTKSKKLGLLKKGDLLYVIGKSDSLWSIAGLMGRHYWYQAYRTTGWKQMDIGEVLPNVANFKTGEPGWVYGALLEGTP